MASEIEEYVRLRGQLDDATARVEELIKPIIAAGRVLSRDWRVVRIMGPNFPFPAHIGGRDDIDGERWPAIADVAQYMANWHSLNHDVNNAWNAIPQNQRGALQPPPHPAR